MQQKFLKKIPFLKAQVILKSDSVAQIFQS